MITEKIGDLLEDFENGKVNVIAHQCNCMHTMGAGIARIIADKFPEAEDADKATPYGSESKLGTFSVASLPDGRKIVNLYGQFTTSRSERATSYDAIFNALFELELVINNSKQRDQYTIGIPYGMSSDLAGASWTVIRAMLERIFGKSPVKLVIVRLPSMRELA